MGTDSLFLALAEKKLYDCKRSGKRQKREILHSKNCKGWFIADVRSYFFSACVVLKTKKNMIKKNVDCSKKNFDALNCYVCVARPTAVTIL